MIKNIDQLEYQLSLCGCAARGIPQEAYTGEYGWSPEYQDVIELRKLYDNLTWRINKALEELGVPGEGYPAPVDNAVELLKYGKIKD